MLTIIETPVFLRHARRIWNDDERDEFVDWIAENPEADDVIPGFAPLRKVRWNTQGQGKQGGARVIYFSRKTSGEVLLLIVYAKSGQATLSHAFLRELQKETFHE